MPQTPAASPSIPSRKLTMFMTATMKSIESGTPSHAGTSSTPRNGNVTWSIHTPNMHGIEAATNWPMSFTDGDRPRKSSTAPTTVATAAPRRTPLLSSERSRNASDGTRMPRKIARPPRRGIGRRLSRRASGRSTAPSMRAIPPTAGVRSTTMTNAMRAPYRTSGVARSSSNILRLFRAVQAVACVAEAREDVALLVQAPVDGRDHDANVGMLAVHSFDALGRGDERDESHGRRARSLHRLDRSSGRVPGCEHRVEQDDVALAEVVGELHVVLDRLESLLVPEEPDEADTGAGDER